MLSVAGCANINNSINDTNNNQKANAEEKENIRNTFIMSFNIINYDEELQRKENQKWPEAKNEPRRDSINDKRKTAP
jgi:hypothetical protein